MVNKKNQLPLVMIVGMHRSGTSVIGHLLEEMGFDFGSNLLEGINTINDRGFWEDREVVALNEHIFELFGSSWFDFERLPGKWWEDEKAKDLIGVAETWFMENFDREKPIGVKDPRFCRLLPFWKRVFFGMDIPIHVLFVIRHPAEVAASLKKRDGFSLQLGYLLWLSYVIDGLYYSRNLEFSILDYQSVLNQPEKIISRLMQKDLSGIKVSKRNVTELIKTVIDLESRHHTVDQVVLEGEVHGDVHALAHELYDVLLTASADEAKSVADKYRKRWYRLLDHHKEFLSALQATVKKQVEVNQKLSEVGSGHSHALSVIKDKDKQLEENKIFIQQCLAEIANKDSLLTEKEQVLTSHQFQLREREDIAQKSSVLSGRFEDLQQVLQARELKLSESLAYIEKCVARIAEQDQWLVENKEYIGRCESRIREQDEGLHQRDKMLGERLDKISSQEQLLSEKEQHIEEKEKEVIEARGHVARLELQHDSLNSLLQEKEAKLINVKKQIAESEARFSAQQNNLEASEKKIAEQQNFIAERDARIGEKMAVIEGMQNEIAEAKRVFSQIEAELSLEKINNSNLENQLTEVRDSLAEIKNKLEQREEKLLDQNNMILKYQKESADLYEAIVQRDGKINEFDRTVKEQLKSLAETRELLSKREIRIAEQDKSLAALQADLVNTQAVVDKQNNKIHEKDRLLLERQDMLSANHDNISLLEKRVDQLCHSVEKQAADLEVSALRIDSDKNRINDLENMLADLRGQKQKVDEERLRLENLDALSKQRISLQKKQIDTLKAHAAALESELVALKAQNDSKHSEIERYRSYRVVRLIDKLVDTDKQ